MEVILYSKECNWYTRCCPLNGGVRYRECPLREAILYWCMYLCVYAFCDIPLISVTIIIVPTGSDLKLLQCVARLQLT